MAHSWIVLAQAGGGGMDLKGLLFMILPLIAIWYFLIIRPQQKQTADHRTLLSSLKKGDDVLTQGGMLGKIYAVSEKVVTLEIASGVRIRVLKSSIQGRGGVEESAAAPTSAETKQEK